MPLHPVGVSIGKAIQQIGSNLFSDPRGSITERIRKLYGESFMKRYPAISSPDPLSRASTKSEGTALKSLRGIKCHLQI